VDKNGDIQGFIGENTVASRSAIVALPLAEASTCETPTVDQNDARPVCVGVGFGFPRGTGRFESRGVKKAAEGSCVLLA
jgi:hypothetical protein